MMAQTELMLRHLCGNKIVGYTWMLPWGKVKEVAPQLYDTYDIPNYVLTEIHSFDMKTWDDIIGWENSDSFELGIKVRDEWWFEGDRGHFYQKYRNDIIQEFDFLLFWNGSVWDTRPENPYRIEHIILCLERSKKIGTIHDEVTP